MPEVEVKSGHGPDENHENSVAPEHNDFSGSLRQKLGVGLLAGLSLLGGTIGCTRVTVPPGQEAVIVKKPWFFGHGGVEPEPTKTGAEWRALSTDFVLVDIVPKQYDEQFDDMQSSDNIPVDFNAYIKIRVLDSPKIIANFGEDWYKHNIREPFRTMIRDEAKRRPMTDLTVGLETVGEIQNTVLQTMRSFVKEAGIPVEIVSVVVGKISPPEEVLHEIANTGAQQQRAKTEDMRKHAEDIRKAAENARAEADNAYRNQIGLSPEQFIELERIKASEKVGVKVAESHGNTVILNLSGSSKDPSPVVPVNNVPK